MAEPTQRYLLGKLIRAFLDSSQEEAQSTTFQAGSSARYVGQGLFAKKDLAQGDYILSEPTAVRIADNKGWSMASQMNNLKLERLENVKACTTFLGMSKRENLAWWQNDFLLGETKGSTRSIRSKYRAPRFYAISPLVLTE